MNFRICKYIKNDNRSLGLLSYPLIKDKLYQYIIIDFIMEDEHNHIIYELNTDNMIEILSKKKFENYFKDIQEERKLKLEKLNGNR